MRKHKERAAWYFGLFLVFMLICTIVSRGIYASRMPKVTAGTIEAKTLVREIKANGTVVTKEEVPVVTEAGVLVEKVCVVEGQKVEPGDLLFQVETEDLKRLLQQADVQIQTEEAKLAELNASGSTAVNRASQDLPHLGMSAVRKKPIRRHYGIEIPFPLKKNIKRRHTKRMSNIRNCGKHPRKRRLQKRTKMLFPIIRKALTRVFPKATLRRKQLLRPLWQKEKRN